MSASNSYSIQYVVTVNSREIGRDQKVYKLIGQVPNGQILSKDLDLKYIFDILKSTDCQKDLKSQVSRFSMYPTFQLYHWLVQLL